MSRRAPSDALLVRVHLPDREPSLVFYGDERFGKHEGVFWLGQVHEDRQLQHLGLWKLADQPVLQSGQSGDVVVFPLAPAFWARLRPGQTIELQHVNSGSLSCQVVEPLDPEYARHVFTTLTEDDRAWMTTLGLSRFEVPDP